MGRIHLILLATDTQDSLDEGTEQLAWLRRDLAETSKRGKDVMTLVFMHYSLVLHPLHNHGKWDDGLQLIDNASTILDLLHSYKKVKAVTAGHKNVPSTLVDEEGLLHTLSPQLIQVPCGYDIMDIYEHGLIRVVHEIEEMDLQDVSANAAGKRETTHRWGMAGDRCFFDSTGSGSRMRKSCRYFASGSFLFPDLNNFLRQWGICRNLHAGITSVQCKNVVWTFIDS
jgi:hypothetical protein